MAIPSTFPTISYVTDYNNPGGKGDRTGIVSVWASYVAQSGTPSQLLDGDNTSTGVYSINPSQGLNYGWIFDFGTPKYIEEITWYQNAPGPQGTFAWEGSADGVVWNTVYSPLVLGNGVKQVIPIYPIVSTAFRYYRLINIGGELSNNTVYCQEIEFKIDDMGNSIPVPDCDFQSYDNVTFTIDENEFGDGYGQRSASGINNARDSWSASWTNVTTREKNTIVNFIRAQKGFASFYWIAPGDSIAAKWSARDLKIQPVDAGIWALTITMRQEFDL
jgi:phage-related protein